MKRRLIVLPLLFSTLSTLAVSALAAGPVGFVGSIWDSGGVSLRFDEHVPPGQKRTMQLPGKQVVEMSVNAEGQATVRLLDPSGNELQSSSTPPGGPNPVEFMYSFCRKGVIQYSSPLPPKGRSGCP